MKSAAILLLLLMASCSPTKQRVPLTMAALDSDCPKQARCIIELLPGKGIAMTTDANGLRYDLTTQPGMSVVIYKYDKIVKGNLQDAGYREEVIFEYDGARPLDLTDAQLQSVKMLYGRFCYCKGQTGYFAVSRGKLLVAANGKANLQFQIAEVSQVIKDISFTLQ